MKRFGLLLFLSFCLPTYIGHTDTLPVARHTAEIRNSFSKLIISQGPVQEVKLYHPPYPVEDKSFSFVRTAEAFARPSEVTFRNFEVICNKVNEARRIDDLTKFLSDENIRLLHQELEKGASEQVLLSMFHSMRPQNIQVIDAVVEASRATLSVTGQSSFGHMNGLIHMVLSDGTWKIDQESWYAGYDHYTEIHSPIWISASGEKAPSKNFIAKYDTDYKFNTKILSLTKVPYTRDKKSFTFVYVMNKPKPGPKRSELMRHLEANGVVEKNRPYVHLLWTGSKRILRNQHMIKNQFPMDVSIAPANDGFAAGEWNVILPKKKPHGVRFALLWAF